jgi:AraC family transcriptional regulator
MFAFGKHCSCAEREQIFHKNSYAGGANRANETPMACVQQFMIAREGLSHASGACPVTDAAGNVIRRRNITGFALSEALYPAGMSLDRHCHAHSYLTLVLEGSYTEKHSFREFQWREGAVHLLPAGDRHENRFETAVRMLRVDIQPEAVRGWGTEQARLLAEPREISGPLSAWLANRMVREFLSEDDVAPLAIEGVLLEMLAESARASSEARGSNAPVWLKRVRELLNDSYLDAPGLTSLAGIAGVHPVHLSREFHRHYRMTIGEFVRQRRVEHASELLSNSELSLAEIANACGFSDQSHFCSLFKKHCGVTPAKFRKLAGEAARELAR